MKTIGCWDDLTPFGVVPLTGEACGLMYRILCDLTAHGQLIIEKCLGLKLLPAEPWNRGRDADPDVGSILLAHELLVPVGLFALLESGCLEVLRAGDCLYGIESADSPAEVRFLRARFPNARSYAYRGTAGDRNRHQMSGRVS